MSARGKTREDRIAAVVRAWNELPQRAKPELMDYPDIYWAVAWLASYETARAEMRND